MSSEQRGARWLAREQREIGAAGGDSDQDAARITPAATEPPRYPLSDCMSDKALLEWWMVMREFGLG